MIREELPIMDMPYSHLASEKLAYMAGIVDGEGSITLRHAKGIYLGVLTISNTDVRLMEWIVNNFGGKTYLYSDHSPKHKPCYKWIVASGKLFSLLAILLPYLVLKVEQAEKVMSLWRLKRAYGLSPGHPASKGFCKAADVLGEATRILNKRGVSL